ncbi:phage tail tape measure protein [Bariatricus sp. SGI.019]|uniref:phage tail tape measure protein n=1 Tax=Bariatricus sp. SGI.019 TaxID=3420548 RepID=UPI003CFF3169
MPMDFDVNVKVRTTGAEKIDALEKQVNSLKTESIKVKVDVDKSSLSKVKLNTNGLKIKPTVDTSGIKQVTKDFQMVKNLATQISQTKIKIAGLDTSKNANEISVLQKQLRQMESDYRILMKTFSSGFDKNQLGSLEKIFGNADDKIEQINAKAKDLTKSMQSAVKPFNTIDATTASNKTLTWLKNNSKAAKDYGDRLRELAELQRTATNADDLKNYTKQVNEIKTLAASQGKTGASFGAEFKRAFGQIGQFATIYGTIQRIPEYAMKAANAVLEVDTAMTELRKVSSDSDDAQIGKYFDHATESAKKYGATINEVINSAADWKRLGYSVQEAEKLADVTTLLEKVGDNMTQESASSGLTSTLKGFQKSADEAQKIVDAVNSVSNTQPIATDGLFSALERSASSMNAANNSLEQTIGLITAANSVVQDPESVGTAFKTISMRIRGATTELEEAGLETDGMAESTAKLREEIMALSGVDIMIDENNFKSTYDILDELSQKWSDLTDIQQASITELIAGKRQGNIVSALMTNFDIARESMQTAMNSDGSAEKELSNYQQSLQYSLDKMKATAQEFANVTLDSSWLKAGVDGAQTLLEILTQLMDVGGGIPLMLGAIGGVKLFKNLDQPKSWLHSFTIEWVYFYGENYMVA